MPTDYAANPLISQDLLRMYNCTYFAAEYVIFRKILLGGGELLLDKYHQVIKLRSMSDFQGKIDFKVLQRCLAQLKASIKRLSQRRPILSQL